MAIDVRIPGEGPSPKTRIFLDAEIVALIHKMAKAEGLELSKMLERMVVAYAREKGWEIVGDDAQHSVPVASDASRRSKRTK